MTIIRYISYSCISIFLLLIGLRVTYGQTIRRTDPVLKVMDRPDADTVEICILGDMMMHKAQIENAHRCGQRYDFTSYLSHIRDKVSRADIAIANMEFTLAGEPYEGYPTFSAPDCYAEYLADCGIDVFLAANNHIFDKGSEGAGRTIEIYRNLGRSHGIKYCGLAADIQDRTVTYPLTVNVKGLDIAMVNCTYGTNIGADRQWPKVNYMSDRDGLKEALMRCNGSDFTIVLPHWGNEYELRHSEKQKETAQWLIDNGADIIVGTHPHVVQDIGTIDGVTVVYSIGNAISNMSAANTQIGLMATIRLVRDRKGKTKVLPMEFTYLWCSRPGGYCSSYTIIPVKEFIGTRDIWQGSWEYDKMVSTWERVSAATGIRDNSTK